MTDKTRRLSYVQIEDLVGVLTAAGAEKVHEVLAMNPDISFGTNSLTLLTADRFYEAIDGHLMSDEMNAIVLNFPDDAAYVNIERLQ